MGRKGPKTKTYNHLQVTLDKILGSKNLWRKPIAKDGSCLFRAVAEQVLLCQSYHHDVRLQCADYIQRHRDDFKEFLTMKVDTYLAMLRDGQLWGGEVELVVFSKMYRRSIVVYNQQENRVQEQVFFSPEDEARGISLPDELCNPIILAYSDGNHYDSVYTKKHRGNMAFCQSLLYSLLYEKVFDDPLSQSSKVRLKSLYESELQKLATDKCDKHLAFLSKTYPMCVLEGMGQNCYSNTALYVYQRERECIEQKDRSVAASIQFQVGDKCLVPVPGEPGAARYKGEIASPLKANACHMVFIYDVGEQWEIPCKDITLPPPSPAPPPVKQSSGPPKAWSKVHQRNQPAANRKQNSGDRSPPPLPSSASCSPLSLPLPDPIPSTLPFTIPGLVAQQQTVQSNQPEYPTAINLPPPLSEVPDTNQPPSKTSQSQPKGPTVPKSVSAKSTRVSQSSTSLLGAAPRIPPIKGGGAEVGGASQRPGRKLLEAVAAEEPSQRKDETRATLPQSKAGSRPMHSSGAAVMGGLAPGFPAGKRSKVTSKLQKVSEGDRFPSVPVQPTDLSDLSSSLIKSPTDMKFPSPTPPATAPLLGGGHQTAGTFPREQNSTYSPVVAKTPAGPRGSLSTSDESASSSDESGNGHHPSNPTQSTANTTAVPMTFFSHLGAMGQTPLPVVLEGKAISQPPSAAQSAQVASVLERPLMHAPLPQTQPPQPHPPVPLSHRVRPGLPHTSPPRPAAQQMSAAGPAQDPGRESPYLESRQLPESSQPEEAWPMVGEELQTRDQLHESLASSLAPLPSGVALVPPFGVPPSASPDPALAMVHPPHIQPPLHPAPFNPSAPLPPHMFPFMFLPPQQRELSFESKEVQTSPSGCDSGTQTEPSPVKRDREVQVKLRPPRANRYTQCSVKQKEVGCQTDLQAMGEPLLLLEEIKPPEMTDDSVDAQLHFITDYTLQCLRAVMRHSPEAADKLSGTVELVETFEKAFQERIEEERQRARKEASAAPKPLNMDEQNFLQLFNTAQQSLPESLQGRVLPGEEPGRQGRTKAFPYHLQGLPAVSHIANSVELEDTLSRSSNATSDRADGGEEEGNLQPPLEASVHPYPHVAPSPMVVPPGARPMVMSVPGMPPMGWYPYMPFPFFIPPHMNMMQHAPPPMAPGQGPDNQAFLPDEAPQLPQSTVDQDLEGTPSERQERPVSGKVKSETMATLGRSGDQEKERHSEEGGDGGRVTAEVPMAFPSADVKTEHSVEGLEGARMEMVAEPPSPQTRDLVTPLVEQNSLSWPPPPPHLPASSPPPAPPSPSVTAAPPDEDNTLSSWEAASHGQPLKDSPLAQQSPVHPGLPCRRRDAADVDNLSEKKEGAEQSQSKGEKEDTPLSSSPSAALTSAPAAHKQRQGRGKSRQTPSSYRSNRGARDGSHQTGKPQHHTGGSKSGSGQSSRSGRQHQQYQSSSQQSVPTQSSQHTPRPSSGTEDVSSSQPQPPQPQPQPQPQAQAQTHQVQPTAGKAGGVSSTGGEKTGHAVEADSSGGAKTGNSSTARVKPGPTGAKTDRTGTKTDRTGVKTDRTGVKTDRTGVAEAGGSGGVKASSSGTKGGVKAGGVEGGSSGPPEAVKTSSNGSTGREKTGNSGPTEGVEASSSGRPGEEGEGERTESMASSAESKTSRPQQAYYKAHHRYKDGRRPGGSSGGYRSNPPRGQPQGNRSSQVASSHDTSSSHKQKTLTNGGKPGKGDAAKKPRKYGVAPSSANQNQHEPTRGTRENSPMAETVLAHPLPSFKNLYSSSPKDECEEMTNTQNCWPSWTDDGHQLTTSFPLSPLSPHTPTAGREQSSTSHFPLLAHSSFAQCTYDSIISQQDIRNWNKADILQVFPALLDPTLQTSPNTNLA